MLIPTKRSIKLECGHTYEEFVIRYYAIRASYAELCQALKISFDEAREIYDKVYNLPLSQIGEWCDKERPALMCAAKAPSRLETFRTGTDWRAK